MIEENNATIQDALPAEVSALTAQIGENSLAQLDKSQINTILEAIAKLLATSTSMSQDDLMSSIMAKMWIHQSQKDSFTKQASADALEVLLNNDSPEKLDQEKKYWYKLLQETDQGLKLLQQKEINQNTFREDYRILSRLEENLKTIQEKDDIPTYIFIDKDYIYNPDYPEALNYITALRPILRGYSYDPKKKEEKRRNKDISQVTSSTKKKAMTVKNKLVDYRANYCERNYNQYLESITKKVLEEIKDGLEEDDSNKSICEIRLRDTIKVRIFFRWNDFSTKQKNELLGTHWCKRNGKDEYGGDRNQRHSRNETNKKTIETIIDNVYKQFGKDFKDYLDTEDERRE